MNEIESNVEAEPLDSSGGVCLSFLQEIVDALTKDWALKPEIVIVPNLDDPLLPENFRSHNSLALKNGADEFVDGFIGNGKVFLNGCRMQTVEYAARTVFHEVLGHYGFRKRFDKSDQLAILEDIARCMPDALDAKLLAYGLARDDESAMRWVTDEQGLEGTDSVSATSHREQALEKLARHKMVAAEELLACLAQDHPWFDDAGKLHLVRRPSRDPSELSPDELRIIREVVIPARELVNSGKSA